MKLKNNIHPAFAEIMKQLSEDEIKILKYMAKSHSIPTISITFENLDNEQIDVLWNFSILPELSGCARISDRDLYMENLIRLGLIRKSRPGQKLADKEKYTELKQHPHIVEYSSERMLELYNCSKCIVEEGFVDLSVIGKNLCAACLDIF